MSRRAVPAIVLLALSAASIDVARAAREEVEAEATEPATEQEEEEPILGRSSAASFEARPSSEAAETFDLPRGSRLRLAPDLASPLIEIVPEAETVPVLERHEEWVRVRYGIWKGWVLSSGPDTGLVISAAPLDRQASVVGLDSVLEIMGGGARRTALGPYELITDVRGDSEIERLAPLVESLAGSYRQRFGIDPGPPRSEVIVLFRREDDYRRFERNDLDLAGVGTEGYTGEAMIGEAGSSGSVRAVTFTATFLGDRDSEPLREVLVHELTHMLNRRAIGPYLPPWLEEGLAEDLAFSRVDGSGRLVLGSWGGSTEISSYAWAARSRSISTTLTGSRAALQALLLSWRTPYRPELEQLTRLSWQMLITPASRSLLYAQSAFLTRYLLDGAGERTARRFRGYFVEVAEGDLGGDALWSRLEARPAALEDDFYRWLRGRASAYGVSVPR